MTARFLAIGIAFGLTACGGVPTRSGSTVGAAQLWHGYAQCVRNHGAPEFPDPVVDDQGRAGFRDDAARAAAQRAPESAMAACASYLNRLPAAARDDAPSVDQLRHFAQCMRGQGLDDWPDPTSDGRFPLPASLTQKSGPRRPQVQAAMTGPCRQFNPSGRIPTA